MVQNPLNTDLYHSYVKSTNATICCWSSMLVSVLLGPWPLLITPLILYVCWAFHLFFIWHMHNKLLLQSQNINTHICVYCLMNPIKTLEQTLAPFMWNGIIEVNSAWMFCHSYEESNVFPLLYSFKQNTHWFLHRLLGLEENAIDCFFLLLYCLHRVNRETTAWQKVLQAPKVTEWVSYMCLFLLCCLLEVSLIV